MSELTISEMAEDEADLTATWDALGSAELWVDHCEVLTEYGIA